MIFKRPAIRLSFALSLLTVNLLLFADLIGFIPDTSESVLEVRKGLSESLALQFTAVAEKNEFQIIQHTLRAVVENNTDIKSAAIRSEKGKLIAVAGEHLAHWESPAKGKSTPTHIQVPIYRKGKKWAMVQIRFAPIWNKGFMEGGHSQIALFTFIGLTSFLSTYLLLKRSLRELDPSSVIPERVNKAFNVLHEGVLLLDNKEQIVMANRSFAEIFNKAPETMIGLKGSELGWHDCESPDKLPWIQILNNDLESAAASLSVLKENNSKIKLSVNAVKISDPGGLRRGCLITFDDITRIEEQNFELNVLVEKLRQSKKEIQAKSLELEFLATRDPLTLCLNRRALDKEFDILFTRARADNTQLSCLMADIDFFKLVNDRYGHATGDQVIKAVADVLKVCTRDCDLVGRYGGEEFCVVLPDLDIEQAMQVAERIRLTIEKKDCSGVRITSSLGVSSLAMNPGNPNELVNQADKALYAAKTGGRNRVVSWGMDEAHSVLEEAGEDKDTNTEAAEVKKQPDNDSETEQLKQRIKELEGILEKRRLESEHYEMYDIKTGWPTRSLFEDRITLEITRCKRQNKQLAVLSINIDTIERVEKTLGSKASALLLKSCGNSLNEALRRNMDTLTMMKSHEQVSSISLINQTNFGILLTGIKQIDHITWIIKRLLDGFEKPFQILDNEIYVSAFIGVSIFPYDGRTMEELYNSAANACTWAKTKGNDNRYRFASQNINAKAITQLQIESALFSAIENKELRLHFQPLIKSRTEKIAGFEALLRWTSEDFGSILPNEFIPIAERSGQIQRLGDWVIYQACAQLRRWLDNGLDVGYLAINMSGLQLRQLNLPRRIKQILDKFSIQPSRLEIELTESSLINSQDQSFAVLKQIRDMGIRIAMDDFGTGYSSLSYLRNIPLTSIKIDQSFTSTVGKDRRSDKLLASIVSMAHGLGLEVVAEGVEKRHQADFLIELGCEYLQGFLYSRPVPPAEAADLLNPTKEEQASDR